jgi:hypothetical protein
MATVEQPEVPMQVCEWCRMAIHVKCEGRKLHGFCQCQCDRGY